MGKLAPEVVASQLNDWQMAIQREDLKKSEDFYKSVKSLFDEMEEDQEVLAYYSLLEERHKMLMHSARGDDLRGHSYFTNENRKVLKMIDDKLEFNFHLYEGMYEAYKKNYDKAINSYSQAERKLEDIHDEIERAEFYFKVSYLYSLIKQSIISQHYIKKSLLIYGNRPDYKRKFALSSMITATNYGDLKKFDLAEKFYKQAIALAEEIDDELLTSQMYHNVSILYSDYCKSNECINALTTALKSVAWRNSGYYPISLYMLMRELYKAGDSEKAKKIYEELQDIFMKKENKIYQAKTNIVHSIFSSSPDTCYSVCLNCISVLEDENDLEGVSELSLMVARFFEKQNYYDKATYFLKRRIWADEEMKKLEGEI
ncbi:RapH N-terminal domain-containing protein [Bacillus safensis]|uniref:response regulator aspartate phosphatase n=2 Tax=Bacillus safensis TaxID=561879 RepID=UPI000DAE7C2D|nr:RapH N-terminal domain-containing protein [Bacillus safensis]MCM2988287.1 RapH N-terminal domain-containing protein [Bacillus safensis]